ncbi:MAG: hypothetical protein M1834_007329 [Cirrosporium novae-zelandiae]|nr:MAG: hypothetical protein M1834_007329 [Cirrosporium novae-zelandiae]
MEEKLQTTPRVIIHGGAGSIDPHKLPVPSRLEYFKALHSILLSTSLLLESGATAVDASVHAVTLFEDCPLFNCSHGAVFTRTGTIELEASLMVSRGPGSKKRAVGVNMLKRVKHPIQLAKEMLVRGDREMDIGFGWLPGEDGMGDEGCAGGHVQLCGETAEIFAKNWGLEMVEPEYFFTEKRWNEHIRGLEREKKLRQQLRQNPLAARTNPNPQEDTGEPLPQGTVGCVCLDRYGDLATATSTGGLTNKLPGRIGDTPTVGAGFWAEEWVKGSSPTEMLISSLQQQQNSSTPSSIPPALHSLLYACLPSIFSSPQYSQLPQTPPTPNSDQKSTPQVKGAHTHSLALSGTGNGDTFLRLQVARSCASLLQLSPDPTASLQGAVTAMSGPSGIMQSSAGNRWGRTGEGEGGLIGIEISAEGKGKVAFDFNSGGMWRAWVDDDGGVRVGVLRGDDDTVYQGPTR